MGAFTGRLNRLFFGGNKIFGRRIIGRLGGRLIFLAQTILLTLIRWWESKSFGGNVYNNEIN
jgi:hypothetical protein